MSLSGLDEGSEACSRSWPTSVSVWVAAASVDAVNEPRWWRAGLWNTIMRQRKCSD